MNIKTIVLATILATGIPVAVQAQETNDLQNYQVSCNANSECSNLKVNYEQEGDQVAQVRRTRTRRTRSSSLDSKYYAGATIGAFFPSQIDNYNIPVTSSGVTALQQVDPGTGFGGSIYGGYKFTDKISADVEGLIYGGNADPLDGSYTSFGLFVNPRYTYTLDPENNKSIYLFASPGIGVGNVNFGGDLGDALGDNDSGTGFAIQGKVGAGYPVSDKIDLIGQARYTNIFSAVDVPQVGANGTVVSGETDSKGFSTFGIEVGANYNF